MRQRFYSLEHRAVWKLGSYWITKAGERDVLQRRKSLGKQGHDLQIYFPPVVAIGVAIDPYHGGTSLNAPPLWLSKCLQGVSEKSKVMCNDIRVLKVKAERKRATAKETLLNKYVALFRPLAKMASKEEVKGYSGPKVSIVHGCRVETPRNKQQAAKREGPRITDMIEYLAQEVICHMRDSSNDHVSRLKKVTKRKLNIE
jgi:hypothetical protein